MRGRLVALALACSGTLCISASPDYRDTRQGWIQLFDGDSLFGWTSIGRSAWKATNGVLGAESGDTATLRTNVPFADFELHLEFRVTGSAGVYLRIPASMKLEDASRLELDDHDPYHPPGSLVGEQTALRVEHGKDWSALDVLASGSHVTVRIDGQVALDAVTSRSSLGYIGLYSATGAKAEFRNVRLRPLNMKALYNGNNLDGWKLTEPQEQQKQGPHKILMIPLPGSSGHKDKHSEWSVEGGLIHGTRGPGQIETQTLYDNFILQFESRDNSGKENSGKDERGEMKLVLRGQAGKFASGYESPMGNPRQEPVGNISRFRTARGIPYTNGEFVTETVAAYGRHIALWVNGYPVTDFEDRRPLGQNLALEARVGKGTVAFAAMSTSADEEFRSIRIATLSEPPPPAKPQPPPAVAPTPAPSPRPPATLPSITAGAVAAPPSPPAPNPVVEQLARQQAAEQMRQQTTSQLMQQALTRNSPEEQISIYNEILKIDPSNQVAFNARKEAEEKIDQRDKEAESKLRRTEEEKQQIANRQTTKQHALEGAERALLRGDLHEAGSDIRVARGIAPRDPAVMRMDSILRNRLQVRNRIRWMLFGAGGAGFFAGLWMLFRRIRRHTPYLFVSDGLDKGKEYTLKTRVTRIGAVAQEGGMQNDIVVKDLDHSISRFHCEIHQLKGKLYLLDCNSSNGTFVNGQALRPQRPVRLGRGSRIGLGRSYTLTVQYRGSAVKKNQGA